MGLVRVPGCVPLAPVCRIPGLHLPVFQPGFYKGPAGSQVTLSSLGNQTRVLLEEQARHLLSEQERATMTYYLDEYRRGSVSVEALVMALFELLNTHAKVTCLPVPTPCPQPPRSWARLSCGQRRMTKAAPARLAAPREADKGPDWDPDAAVCSGMSWNTPGNAQAPPRCQEL